MVKHACTYQRADGTFVRDTNVRAHRKALSVGDVFASADFKMGVGWLMKPDLKTGIVYWQNRSDGYVEEDGRRSFEKDYANNLEYFFYDPAKLKKTTPGAYNWIQKKFGAGSKTGKDRP